MFARAVDATGTSVGFATGCGMIGAYTRGGPLGCGLTRGALT